MNNFCSKKTFQRGLILAVFLTYYLSHSTCAAGLVPCTNDCNLCFLLVGISNIFQWLMGSLLMIAFLLGITIAGLSYMVSGAFPKALTFAKSAFTNSLKGFLLALCAWIILNSIMNIVGYKNPQGGTWYQHVCSGDGAQVASTSTACDPKNKKLESVTIQCAEQKEALADNGSGFYVALDTLSGDEKSKTKQLKAIGKYSCDGTTSEEDITQQAEWKASDETQIKVAKGLVQAVTTSLGSSSESVPYVEAKFQDKNSNQAKVYINSCPNTTTANTEIKNKFSFSENSLSIPKANAQTWDCPNCKTPNNGDTTCKSCGQNNTCHFVYGNENAKYMFILMRNQNRCISFRNASDRETWTRENNDEYEQFKNAATKLAKQIDYTPGGSQNFAVYREDQIAEPRQTNCPTKDRSLVSIGFMCRGQGSRPGTTDKDAYYFWNHFNQISVFAHEQIGHIFAGLDDEYSECGKDPISFYKHYNCTSWNKVSPIYQEGFLGKKAVGFETKWGQKKDLWKGCSYSTNLIRSSETSIMLDQNKYKTFEYVNDEVIKRKIETYPDGPYSWIEQLDVTCSAKL